MLVIFDNLSTVTMQIQNAAPQKILVIYCALSEIFLCNIPLPSWGRCRKKIEEQVIKFGTPCTMNYRQLLGINQWSSCIKDIILLSFQWHVMNRWLNYHPLMISLQCRIKKYVHSQTFIIQWLYRSYVYDTSAI